MSANVKRVYIDHAYPLNPFV